MNLDIRKLELIRRIEAHMQTGQFRDLDDLLEQALDALDEQTRATHPRDAHERWIKRLRTTWPEGVAARQLDAAENSSGIEPWPDTWRDPEGPAMQCLHCRYYVALSGPLRADWGACANERSQYDGELVFEHWTCRYWADVSTKAN